MNSFDFVLTLKHLKYIFYLITIQWWLWPLSDYITKHYSVWACSFAEIRSYFKVIYCCWRYCLTSYRYYCLCFRCLWCYLFRCSFWFQLSWIHFEEHIVWAKGYFLYRLYHYNYLHVVRILGFMSNPNHILLSSLCSQICYCCQV